MILIRWFGFNDIHGKFIYWLEQHICPSLKNRRYFKTEDAIRICQEIFGFKHFSKFHWLVWFKYEYDQRSNPWPTCFFVFKKKRNSNYLDPFGPTGSHLDKRTHLDPFLWKCGILVKICFGNKKNFCWNPLFFGENMLFVKMFLLLLWKRVFLWKHVFWGKRFFLTKNFFFVKTCFLVKTCFWGKSVFWWKLFFLWKQFFFGKT